MTTTWKSGWQSGYEALDNLPLAKLFLREIISIIIGRQGCVRFRTGGPGEGITIDRVGFTKVMTAVL